MSIILIIEDDMPLADDIKFFIEEIGHSCQIYTRADEVIDNIDNFAQFDWIILDIMMLRGEQISRDVHNSELETGEMLYQKIRRKYRHKNIFVISAKDFNDMQVDFSKDKYVRLLQKPLTELKLNRILKIINGSKNGPK